MNSQKNSFIFLETILAILILSIIVSGFFKLSYNKDTSSHFNNLQYITNLFNKSQYTTFNKSTYNIKITKNDNEQYSIAVDKISYSDAEIKLVKYELQK